MSFVNNQSINEITEATIKKLKQDGWIDNCDYDKYISGFRCVRIIEVLACRAFENFKFQTIQAYVGETYKYYINFMQEEISSKLEKCKK